MLLASQDHRDAAFRAVEELPGIKVATIRAGNRMHPVPLERIIDLGFDIGAHMAKQRNAGLIIVQDGAIRFERYALGYTATGRWTSFRSPRVSRPRWSGRRCRTDISEASTTGCRPIFRRCWARPSKR